MVVTGTYLLGPIKQCWIWHVLVPESSRCSANAKSFFTVSPSSMGWAPARSLVCPILSDHLMPPFLSPKPIWAPSLSVRGPALSFPCWDFTVLQALFLSPEIERRIHVCIYIYICMGVTYYKVLAYVMMETENSPDLSAICKLQTQESQWSRFQPEAEGPRIRSAHLRAEDWCIDPCLQTEGIQPSWAFYSIRALDELDDAHPCWGGHCFPEPTDLNAKLLQKYLHRHIQKGCLTRGLGTPWSSQVDTWN